MVDEDNIVAPPGGQDQESEIEIVDEELEQGKNSAEDSYDVEGDEVKQVEESPDTTDDEQEEEKEEEDKPEKKEKKKNKLSLKTEFNRVQREKYQAQNEVEQLRKENLRLQQLALQSNEAATSYYEKSIQYKIDQAKSLKKEAYETADTDALLKADEALAEAYNQKSENDRWKAQQSYYKSQQEQDKQSQERQPQQTQQQEQFEVNDETREWLSSNSWINGNSPDYDPEMAADVQDYSAILERKFVREGREDQVFGQDYYNALDKYISENYGEPEPEEPVRQKSNGRMNINMKNIRQSVAPVSSSKGMAVPQNPNRVVLTAKEREFAKLMGQTPETYAKHKLEIQKSNRYGYENYKR